MPTSTRPKIRPAPIVPRPAIKNGMDTCNVVFHHSSCLMGWCTTFDDLRSKSLPSKPPLPWSPPFGSSDDAMDAVVIELNEPCDEGGKAENFSFSLSEQRNNQFIYMYIIYSVERNSEWCDWRHVMWYICIYKFIPCSNYNSMTYLSTTYT